MDDDYEYSYELWTILTSKWERAAEGDDEFAEKNFPLTLNHPLWSQGFSDLKKEQYSE